MIRRLSTAALTALLHLASPALAADGEMIAVAQSLPCSLVMLGETQVLQLIEHDLGEAQDRVALIDAELAALSARAAEAEFQALMERWQRRPRLLSAAIQRWKGIQLPKTFVEFMIPLLKPAAAQMGLDEYLRFTTLAIQHATSEAFGTYHDEDGDDYHVYYPKKGEGIFQLVRAVALESQSFLVPRDAVLGFRSGIRDAILGKGSDWSFAVERSAELRAFLDSELPRLRFGMSLSQAALFANASMSSNTVLLSRSQLEMERDVLNGKIEFLKKLNRDIETYGFAPALQALPAPK